MPRCSASTIELYKKRTGSSSPTQHFLASGSASKCSSSERLAILGNLSTYSDKRGQRFIHVCFMPLVSTVGGTEARGGGNSPGRRSRMYSCLWQTMLVLFLQKASPEEKCLVVGASGIYNSPSSFPSWYGKF